VPNENDSVEVSLRSMTREDERDLFIDTHYRFRDSKASALAGAIVARFV
jgi:hypothetical protein